MGIAKELLSYIKTLLRPEYLHIVVHQFSHLCRNTNFKPAKTECKNGRGWLQETENKRKEVVPTDSWLKKRMLQWMPDFLPSCCLPFKIRFPPFGGQRINQIIFYIVLGPTQLFYYIECEEVWLEKVFWRQRHPDSYCH